MRRSVLLTLGVMWVLTGVLIFAAPVRFYEMTPGLKLMGPFSIHFILDVALAFIASGATLAWGAYRLARNLVLAGIAWPFLHALFHTHIWAHRGFPFDGIFAFDLAAVIAPPVIALVLARNLDAPNG